MKNTQSAIFNPFSVQVYFFSLLQMKYNIIYIEREIYRNNEIKSVLFIFYWLNKT